MSRSLSIIALLFPLLAAAQNIASSNAAPAQCEPRAVPGWPMKYCDLVQGTGSAAAHGDKLSVNYTGWLADGKKFEDALNKRKPFKFVLGERRVIKGWDVGLEGMQVGGRRQLRIPSSMAYGMGGHPPSIPPNADLIFEVDLLDVKKR